WPEELVDRLRARSRPPYLRGWTLHTDGEPPYVVDPSDHDPAARVAADHDAEVGSACLSLSAPLGIEALPRPEATLLVDAWHRGLLALPPHFRGWASLPVTDPDPTELAALLREDRFVGVQLPATQLLSAAAWERSPPLRAAAEHADKPVLVHPGPVTRGPLDGSGPGWWAPVVGYVGQLQAAWWGWQSYAGRSAFGSLRLVFAAGAGLAPLHHERHVLRGGEDLALDPLLYVDAAGYGPRAHDALVRVLGIDALVLGSDRPYGEPVRELFGEAATHAIRVTNPARLLGGLDRDRGGEKAWAFAS
ncbi:MAG: 6-methylsalicylate decarboxylase, partial [Nocardioidaceae bacterium]|nr:6-methylsalicylate decarboxylase [Nocardioidaceae bacterium]